MIPTRILRGPPSVRVPRSVRDRVPDERSVAIAAGDPSPALTGARGRSRAAGLGCSQRPDGPSPWAHDYTTVVHSHATRRGGCLGGGSGGGSRNSGVGTSAGCEPTIPCPSVQ